jgi:DnaJ-class molecular chaperone
MEVNIDKGVKHGHKITFAGMSDEKPGFETGDLQFVVQVAEHATFKRRGADLLYELDISLSESLCGFAIPIVHLDDRTIVIKSEPGEIVKPGDIKCVLNEGMPIQGNPYQKGRYIRGFYFYHLPSLVMHRCPCIISNCLSLA